MPMPRSQPPGAKTPVPPAAAPEPQRTTKTVRRGKASRTAADEDDVPPRHTTTVPKRARSADVRAPNQDSSKGSRTESACDTAAESEHDDTAAAGTATQFDGIIGRLRDIQNALERTPSVSLSSLLLLMAVLQRKDPSNAAMISAVDTCFNATLWDDAFRRHPQRPNLIRALFAIKKALNPVNRAFVRVYETLVGDVVREDRSAAKGLSALMTLLCGLVDRKAVRAQVDVCLTTGDEETRYHLTAVVDALGRCSPLNALAERIEAKYRAMNFRRHYAALFQDMPESRRRAVLSFHDLGLVDFEERQVPVLYCPSIFPARTDTSGLVVVQGGSGSGKSCFGLFQLATSDQLVVFVHTPPVLVAEDRYSAEQKASVESGLSEPVCDRLHRAHAQETRRDQEQDQVKKDTAHFEARRFYKEALQLHILDTLKKRIGTDKRAGDGVVEVVFFFDDLGRQSRNSEVVRSAVRDLALEDGNGGAFERELEAQFGLSLAGVAMVGTGLDVEVPVGSLPPGNGRVRIINADAEGLHWCHFTRQEFEKNEEVPARVEAQLKAVLRLPRLVALVLDLAGRDGKLSKDRLSRCVPAAADRFVALSALSTLARDEKGRREVGQQCLRLMRSPPLVKAFDSLGADTQTLITRYGVAALVWDHDCLKVVVGPAQRLLIRHFFGLE